MKTELITIACATLLTPCLIASTVIPDLSGADLPTELQHRVAGGSGFASTTTYQGRESLVIGATGGGNVFSIVEWFFEAPLTDQISEGSFTFSIYDEFGGATSPFYMHVNLLPASWPPLIEFNWLDSGWGDPNYTVNTPNQTMQVLRAAGWHDFEVNWNSDSIDIFEGGTLLLHSVLSQPIAIESIEITLHDLSGSHSFAVSNLSMTAIPEPSCLATVTLAFCLFAATRRRTRHRSA